MKRFFSLFKKPYAIFKRLSFKRKIIVVVVLILIAFFIWNKVAGGKSNGYVFEPVKRATITQTVSEIGNVRKGASTDVISPSTGIVDEVLVENGDTVVVGDVLFTVTSTATEQEKSAAYSSYLTAQTVLNTANATAHSLHSTMLSKWKTFYDLATNSTYEKDGSPKDDNRTAVEFHTAKDDWLSAEAKYKDQQTAIAQGQADVNSKSLLFQATQNAEVVAQANGIIANLALAKGNGVAAADTALTIVSDTKNELVNVSINEIDIPKIKKGQKAVVTVDALDDKKFDGLVDRVDSVGVSTQGVITYTVYVLLVDSDPRIRTGMTANVDIETETVENALSVPNSAVKPYQGGRAVRILKGKDPTYIPVQIGVRGDERTEILDGLSEGQIIITGATNESVQRRRGLFGF